MRLRFELVSARHERLFLSAARASLSLHEPWVSAPKTALQFRRYLQRAGNGRNLAYLVLSTSGELLGVVHVNEIVLGLFRSAYLGYYVFAPHQHAGVMTEAVSRIVTRAFRKHGLHRLEANIQPANTASIRLVRRLGFRKEGLSRRYLKINGRWRDHERWAITREEW